MSQNEPFDKDVDTSEINSEKLADDISSSISYFSEQLFNGSENFDDTVEMGGRMLPSASELLPLVMPYLWEWAEKHPDEAIIALEILHKESGALLEHHNQK